MWPLKAVVQQLGPPLVGRGLADYRCLVPGCGWVGEGVGYSTPYEHLKRKHGGMGHGGMGGEVHRAQKPSTALFYRDRICQAKKKVGPPQSILGGECECRLSGW
jgi:hypothetical protein